MKIISIEKIEKAFDVTLYKRKGMVVLGLDTASTTGYAIARVGNNRTLRIETGYIKTKGKIESEKFDIYVDVFEKLIKNNYKVVVEDTYMGINAKAFKQITRIGGIAYTIAKIKGCDVSFILASHARKALGIKGNIKKAELQKLIKKIIGIDITHDEADAVVLAINGLIRRIK